VLAESFFVSYSMKLFLTHSVYTVSVARCEILYKCLRNTLTYLLYICTKYTTSLTNLLFNRSSIIHFYFLRTPQTISSLGIPLHDSLPQLFWCLHSAKWQLAVVIFEHLNRSFCLLSYFLVQNLYCVL